MGQWAVGRGRWTTKGRDEGRRRGALFPDACFLLLRVGGAGDKVGDKVGGWGREGAVFWQKRGKKRFESFGLAGMFRGVQDAPSCVHRMVVARKIEGRMDRWVAECCP